jgi:hypothetical protein
MIKVTLSSTYTYHTLAPEAAPIFYQSQVNATATNQMLTCSRKECPNGSNRC